ncbi:ribosome small subunit-dependent GTPase A [Jannaschia sp. 2305UL9-9]|uniref:ribosome small subunit-dependent GTPase A n=1 Tax=Jannaschia sp. 2305UL9-9 TaxID=3121638 RepID=UPI0035282C0D
MARDYSKFLPEAVTAPRPSPLAALGWQSWFAQQVDADEMTQTPPVRVTRIDRSGLTVTGDGIDQVLPPRADVTVGDWLLLSDDAPVLERKSLVKRRAAGHDRSVQLIAANIDTTFIVTSCNADFNVARLERYLALAFDAGTDPVIILTKPDLADPAPYVAKAEAIAQSVPVIAVNAKADGPGVVAALAPWCKPGRTVAFLGSSGVGKSTLVNALSGSDAVVTGAIREDDARGRHTTTRRELYVVAAGFAVLDTPGMRELQLTDVSAGIEEVFADLAELSRNCRFNDCAHETEPGCAVQAALRAGTLDADRMARWKKLAAEDAHNSADLAERRRRDKAFTKRVNKAVKAKPR